jgi:hypothetical protein
VSHDRVLARMEGRALTAATGLGALVLLGSDEPRGLRAGGQHLVVPYGVLLGMVGDRLLAFSGRRRLVVTERGVAALWAGAVPPGG